MRENDQPSQDAPIDDIVGEAPPADEYHLTTRPDHDQA